MKYEHWNFWTIVAATIYTILVITIVILVSVGLIGAFQ